MLLTLDSNVIIASLREQEEQHQSCRRLLEQIRNGTHSTVQPLTVLVEVVGAIKRRTGSDDLAVRVQRDLLAIASFRFLDLNTRRALEAVWTARLLSLRGMDALVVQVAREFGATLVSLDEEINNRIEDRVPVRRAEDF